MFRKMRRFKQLMSDERTAEVLTKATSGVLSLLGDDDYPYGVPISYIYMPADCEACGASDCGDCKGFGTIYFHCAKSGHKFDAMAAHEKVSFTVIDQDQIVGEEFTTYFRSVIAFGRARRVEDWNDEFVKAHKDLCLKYWPEAPDEAIAKDIKKEGGPMAVFAIDIDHMTGKEAKELVGKA